jgi:hypothetical protein
MLFQSAPDPVTKSSMARTRQKVKKSYRHYYLSVIIPTVRTVRIF